MAKHKKPNYYAVRVGRRPGIYETWKECEEQVSKFSNASFKGFDTHDAALAFIDGPTASNEGDLQKKDEIQQEAKALLQDGSPTSLGNPARALNVEVEDDAALMPPPASQSYFDQVPGFVPNNSASFDDEFFRFASSQGIVSGSQQYRRERTRAIRDELKYHYTSQPYDESEALQSIPELSKEFLDRQEKLKVYQNMCREIGVKPRGTIVGCRQELNDVLVNIIDYIDARRVGKKVEIWNWSKFDEFCEYTLQNDKRIDKEEAKADGGFLSALLQRLTGTRAGRKRSRAASEVADPGVMKRKRVYEADSHVPKRSRLSVH